MADRLTQKGAIMKGKVAVVTGGNSGIGRAAAELFARRGAAVVVSGRRTVEGEATVESIRAADGEARFVQADVSKAADIERLVAEAIHSYGRLDYAFNNAGIIDPLQPLTDCSEAEWDSVIGVNLKGVWLSMKFEIAQMLRNGGGAIVNMSSVVGLSANEMYGPAYVASKHGVVGLTRLAAVQYARHGIRVNAVCPGVIRTPITSPYLETVPQLEGQLSSWHALNRIGDPAEVAEPVVWLCSDAASFITGDALPIDGGALAKFAQPPAAITGGPR